MKKVAHLIEAFRYEADDEAAPYLWSDTRLIRFINQAQEEVARRARLLRDASTPSICRIPVLVDQPMVKLDPCVIEIKHAQIEYSLDEDADECAAPPVQELEPIAAYALDAERCWWRQDKGDPTLYLTDVETGKLRLNRIPTRAGTLILEVARMPLKELCRPDDTFEIDDRYVPDLIYWMLWRAYSRKDADTHNDNEAQKNLAIFTSIFGDYSTINIETHLAPNGRRSVTRFW